MHHHSGVPGSHASRPYLSKGSFERGLNRGGAGQPELSPAERPRPPARQPGPARASALLRPQLPVRCQPRGDVASGDLGDYVAPEKRAVDHANCFRIPVKLRFLPVQGSGTERERETRGRL